MLKQRTCTSLFIAAACLPACAKRLDEWQKLRPPVVATSGVVTHNGKPLSDAVVTFVPVEGKHTAFDRTDAEGRFALTTFNAHDGAVAGNYTVTVTKVVVTYEPNPRNPDVLPPLYHAEQSIVPDNYGNPKSSGLAATVPVEGTDQLTLELTGPEGKLRVLVPRRES